MVRGAPATGTRAKSANAITDWHDVQKDFRTNEIAINWNAALVYALAAFLQNSE